MQEGAGNYECKKCDYSTTTRGNLKNHTRSHGYEKYKCKKCDYSTTWQGNLSKHTRIHGYKRYKCMKCDYSTTWSLNDLINHSRMHSGEKFKCEKCDFSTAWAKSLRKHVLTDKNCKHNRIHGDKKHKCKNCNYSTNKASNLSKHNLIHSGEKYKCVNCDFSTIWPANLKKHSRSHRYETMLPVSLKNTKKKLTTNAKSVQDNEQQLHNTKEHFICKICDLTFLTVINLKKHKIKHGVTEQLYSCNLCPFSADQTVKLEAHLLVRHAL